MNALVNLLFGKLPHYTRKARHLHQLPRHSTPTKLLNFLRAEWALQTGKTRPTSMPYIYIIEGPGLRGRPEDRGETRGNPLVAFRPSRSSVC